MNELQCKYFDSDDEIPAKTNKAKKQGNKPKIEPTSNPKYLRNSFQESVRLQIEQQQMLRNPQVTHNEKPQRNPSYTEKIQKNEQKLNQLLFQKTMEISTLQAKCAGLEQQLQTQKELSIALQGKIKDFEDLINAKERSINDYQEQIYKMQSQIARNQKKRATRIENKELHSLMDQMFEENKTIRSKLESLERQYGKYYKILKVMKEEEIHQALEIMDHYQNQMRDFKENQVPIEPMRWQVMGELRERCGFLQTLCSKIIQHTSSDNNEVKRLIKEYYEYLERHTSEVRNVQEGLSESDYQLHNLLSTS